MQMLSDDFETRMIEIFTKQVDKSIRDIEKKYAIRMQYLNKKNACVYAGISAPTLDAWIAQGLPVSRINGAYCINREDIDRFIHNFKL